jgi:uncharacterized protein YegP (UPF0339 family)
VSAHWEIVQTDAPQPWHVRLVAGNGNVVLSSENYTRRRRAESAIAVAAEAFGVQMNRPPTREGDRLTGIGRDGESCATPTTQTCVP